MGNLHKKEQTKFLETSKCYSEFVYTMNRLAYWSLRLGGFVAWNGHRKRNSKIESKIMAELKEDMLVPKVKVKEVSKEYEVSKEDSSPKTGDDAPNMVQQKTQVYLTNLD